MRTPRPLVPADLDSFLSIAQIAHLLRLSPRTVRRWIESGRLQAVRTSARRGRFRVPRGALTDFLECSRAASALLDEAEQSLREQPRGSDDAH